ncbi:hypothetical protein Gotur_003327, partial [Gossypium turneri]
MRSSIASNLLDEPGVSKWELAVAKVTNGIRVRCRELFVSGNLPNCINSVVVLRGLGVKWKGEGGFIFMGWTNTNICIEYEAVEQAKDAMGLELVFSLAICIQLETKMEVRTDGIRWSKGSCRGGASSSSGGRMGRSIGKNRVFQSSFLGAPSGADSHFGRQVVVVDHHNKDYGSNFTNQNRRERESLSDQMKRECSRKVKAESPSDYEMPLPCISSNGVDIDASRSGSSSGRATTA